VSLFDDVPDAKPVQTSGGLFDDVPEASTALFDDVPAGRFDARDLTQTPRSSEELAARNWDQQKAVDSYFGTNPMRGAKAPDIYGSAMTPLVELAARVSPQTVADANDTLQAGDDLQLQISMRQAAGNPMTEQEQIDYLNKRLGTPNRKPTSTEQAVAGTQNLAAGLVNSFTSPVGIATLGQAALPAALGKAATAAFAADMARHIPEVARAAGDASVNGDLATKIETMGNLALQPAFIAHMGTGLAKGPVEAAMARARAGRTIEDLPASPETELKAPEQPTGKRPETIDELAANPEAASVELSDAELKDLEDAIRGNQLSEEPRRAKALSETDQGLFDDVPDATEPTPLEQAIRDAKSKEVRPNEDERQRQEKGRQELLSESNISPAPVESPQPAVSAGSETPVAARPVAGETPNNRNLIKPDSTILEQARRESDALDPRLKLDLTEDVKGSVIGAASSVDRMAATQPDRFKALYDSFSGTRDLLRQKYGETITLWRAQGSGTEGKLGDWVDVPKSTLNFASKETAKKFMEGGRKLIRREIPVDDVVAVFNPGTAENMLGETVKLRRHYEEFIVRNPDLKQTAEPAGPAVAEPTAERNDTAPATRDATAGKQQVKTRRSNKRTVFGDILDDIEQAGGLISKSQAKRRRILTPEKNGPEYDDVPSLASNFHNFIYGNGRGGKGSLTPDKMLRVLQNNNPGKYADMSVPEMWAEIHAASQGRVGQAKAERIGRSHLKQEEQQVKAFGKAQAKEAKTGDVAVAADDLSIGAKLTVDGEEVRVVDVDPDTGDVILEDGTRFGRQRVNAGEVIYSEKIEAPEVSTDFLPQEATLPTLKPMQKAGDLFVNQTEDFALTGEKGTDAERAQKLKADAEKRAAEAKAIQDKQQGSLLDPPIIGMGGAIPSEFEPAKPFKTSNKNATVDRERKERGLEPMMQPLRQSNQSAWDEAMRQVDEIPSVQDDLIRELTESPRAVTPVENALLLHRRVDLRNEYEKGLKNWREHFEGGDMERAAEEQRRAEMWSDRLADLEDVTKRIGTSSGRSLQARKMMANEDYTLAQMELRSMLAKDRNLTPEEHIELIKAHEKIADLQRKIDELEAGRDSKEVKESVTDAIRDTARQAPGERGTNNSEDRILGGIRAKFDQNKRNEITPLVQKLARFYWLQGIREREALIDKIHAALKLIDPEITREETMRAFSGYGNYTTLSKEEIDVGLRDLKGQTQQVLKIEAIEARKPLEKTGTERRTPSDEERRLIKVVNELKRRFGVVVTDPETQLKSALQSRKTYYTNRISDLKHEIEARERTVKTKSPSPTDPELEAMRADYERLKLEHDAIFGKREMTDAQRLKLAIAAAERNEALWTVRLENAGKGVFDKRIPGRKITSPELEAIRARTEAMKEHVKELKDLANPKKTKEEIALQTLKTRMKNRTAKLLEKIATGDFAKKERSPVKLDPEGIRLKAALDIAKQKFDAALEADRWKNMGVFQKGRRITADVYDAARALMTTGEFSFVLRQGKLAVLSHPLMSARALPNAFRALLASDQRAREIDEQVFSHPDAEAALSAKLHLVRDDAKLSRQEEILMGRLVGKIPVVKNFNHAAEVFLNRIRFDMWRAMRRSLTKSGTPTAIEDRQIAMFVNEATGRGGLGKLEAAAIPLARVMFSPRYYASRLQLLAGHSLWGGTMRTRRVIATEYARALIGLGLYYSALLMYFSGNDDDDKKKGRVVLDPRSTDFGKVIVGNTRIDPLAGLSQVAVLAARTVTGQKVTGSGKVVPIRGANVPFGGDKWSDIMARHLRGKLHPVPASVANLFDGTDLGGNEATILNQSQNAITPMTYVDIYAALKDQDIPDGVAIALLTMLGEGLQTYQLKEPKPKNYFK
jgi:hypothetical protein